MTELPLYQCHKQVHALQIADISKIPSGYLMEKATDFVYRIIFINNTFAAKDFNSSMFNRYVPVPGDYYVVYDDGYESFHPRKAFEDGYTLIKEEYMENTRNTLNTKYMDTSSKVFPRDPTPTQEKHDDGQYKNYWILPEIDRKDGFQKPLMFSYTHKKCGTTTKLNKEIAETFARDPKFYSKTFCCCCGDHFDVKQFTWTNTTNIVGE